MRALLYPKANGESQIHLVSLTVTRLMQRRPANAYASVVSVVSVCPRLISQYKTRASDYYALLPRVSKR